MKKLLIIFISLAIGCGYTFSYDQFLSRDHDVLTVSFLDVGQGDAIYIRAPNGKDVLIDGGPDDQVIAKLRETMPRFDQDIDLMIATHPDKDHIAGLIPVFENYSVKKFLHSEIESGTSFDTSLHEHAATEPGMEIIIARRGERFIIDTTHGIYLDILFPDQDTSRLKETNDASIVARLVYGSQSFLLTGDSPISVEQFLARNDSTSLHSTVLKLGHHGSKTSTSDEYLNVVKPTYAIVSAGKNNSYHHPAPSVVDRVNSKQIKILSTIGLGTIIFETNGERLWIK